MELIHETDIVCPHCGESFPLQVDTSQSEQTLIEDCSVCCRPIALTIYCRPGEIQSVSEAGHDGMTGVKFELHSRQQTFPAPPGVRGERGA